MGSHLCHCLLVERDDLLVAAADNEEGGGSNVGEGGAGQVGADAAGDDSADRVRAIRGGNQGSRGTGAGPEETDWQLLGSSVRLEPVDGGGQAFCQQRDIEAKLAGALIDQIFLLGKQIEQQGGETSLLQHAGHIAIAGAEAAAAAAVSEEDDSPGIRRDGEVALELCWANSNGGGSFEGKGSGIDGMLHWCAPLLKPTPLSMTRRWHRGMNVQAWRGLASG